MDGWSGYIPIRHEHGGNLDEKDRKPLAEKVFESPADKIMHNAQYDAGWIKQMGFDINGRIIDTMLIASILDENRFSYSLNAIAYDVLGKVKSEKGLTEAARSFGLDPKAEMFKMPAMYVGPYAEGDAELTLELWNYFQVELEQRGPVADSKPRTRPTALLGRYDMARGPNRSRQSRAHAERASGKKKSKS